MGFNCKRDYYAMAAVNGDEAEIVLYGDVVTDRPVDWWTGEPIEGSFIILSEFMEDLEKLANVKRLTVRINSYGGEAAAGIVIHNRLRELKAEVTVIVDGVAMSSGSLIMCAADKVLANPSSLIMIHKCWCLLIGGYNADELQRIKASNDAYDNAQVAIYKRKTGLTEEALLSMMSDETYMTGAEAVEKGFADALTDDVPVKLAASADRRTLYINGTARKLTCPLPGLPEGIEPKLTEGGSQMPIDNGQLTMNNQDEGTKPRRGAHCASGNGHGRDDPAPTQEDAVNVAVKDERERLAAIDEVANLFDAETVRAAKYGDNPCTAQEMTYQAAQKAAKQGGAFMAALKEDTSASGAASVEASPGEPAAPLDGENPASLKEAKTTVKSLLRGEDDHD